MSFFFWFQDIVKMVERLQTEMTEELDEKVRDSYVANIPLKDFGTVDDIAHICTFLASDDSRYITGQVISVCGGLNI